MIPNHLLFDLLFGVATALPAALEQQSCTEPALRVEWRSLSSEEQQSYIDAVLCLKTKPSRIGLNTNLFDDFPFIHTRYNQEIHNVAAFLPWHRYFTHVSEGALKECGYSGSATYWDWTRDVRKLLKSDILSASGFGGDGSATRTETMSNGAVARCVDDGPFSQLRPAYYALNPIDDAKYEEHCLHRRVIDGDTQDAIVSARYYNSTSVGIVQDAVDFAVYHGQLESGPHGIIHSSLSGDMNPATSPSEPLFFLHHAQIDRLWWLWQQTYASRGLDHNGITKTREGTLGEASLDDKLPMSGLTDDLSVREVMSTVDFVLCYKY